MKSPSSPVEFASEALRGAVARQDFAAAQSAARNYVRTLEALLPALDTEQRKARLREGMRLIEWSRRMLLAARARVAGERARLSVRARYAMAPQAPVNRRRWNA
jgi:hypothetical protein